MDYRVGLFLPSDVEHVLDDEREAQRRLDAGGSTSAGVPALVHAEGSDELCMLWEALPADTAWQAVQRAGAIARLLIGDLDRHDALRLTVTPVA